jgi:dTDP-6-deoxy-L-talose 4-dehydrogenase (NAD+)
MRVLVSGAGGFIGSRLVSRLVADGDTVMAVDRDQRSLGRLDHLADRISTAALDLSGTAGATGRLLDSFGPEAVVHLAWYANPEDYLTSHANLASLAMTASFVDAVLAAGCRKVVVGGTCVEYAPRDRLLVETDPADPRTLYASCKHAAWIIARSLAAERGAELAWGRIFHLHGPTEDPRRLIPWVAGQLRKGEAVDLTDGAQVRDHLHVDDVAAGLAKLLTPGASGIYNVSSGQPVTLRQVLETVGDILGRQDLLRFGARPHRAEEVMFLAGDPSRLRGLGWAPRFGLREGLIDALG